MTVGFRWDPQPVTKIQWLEIHQKEEEKNSIQTSKEEKQTLTQFINLSKEKKNTKNDMKFEKQREGGPVTEENPKSEEGDTDKWDPTKGDLLGTTLRLHGREGRERRSCR